MKQLKVLPFYLGTIFFLMAFVLLVAFNFFPHFFEWIPFYAVKRYHSEALPHHIHKNLRDINFHAIFGLFMVVLNVVQLSESIRKKHIMIHKSIGMLYLLLGSIAVATALPLVRGMYGAAYAEYAVFTLAFLWFFTAIQGVKNIYKGNTRLHRRWMIRNFFMTISTMFIRPFVVFEFALAPQKNIEVAFSNGFWMSTIVAILFSEWYIERMRY